MAELEKLHEASSIQPTMVPSPEQSYPGTGYKHEPSSVVASALKLHAVGYVHPKTSFSSHTPFSLKSDSQGQLWHVSGQISFNGVPFHKVSQPSKRTAFEQPPKAATSSS